MRFASMSLVCLVLVACSGPSDAPDDGAVEDDDGGARCRSDVDCSDAIYCNGIEACAPSLAGADARGCVPGASPCGARFCVEASRTCTDDCVDADRDGHADLACGGDDCDDADATRSPSGVEVCDPGGVDEDCDPRTVGERDADGDDAIDAACCNGARCGEDCDDTRAGVGPDVPETCDGSDDDCDGAVDEGYECSAGDTTTTRDCRTPCGSLGAQSCTAACVWSACTTTDEGPGVAGTCNRCDDDGDGALDEGFACVQGAFLPCTTQCGSRGIGFCSGTCEVPAPTPEECIAPTETCNYCDDDGDGTFEDDRALVEPSPVVWTAAGCGAVTPGTGASCGSATFFDSVPYEGQGVHLSDGSAHGRWQAWFAETGAVGWGPISVDARVWVDAPATPGAAPLDGGWAIVVSRVPCGSGPTNDVGVPLDCEGIAVEWRFADADIVWARRLTGSGDGVVLGSGGRPSPLELGDVDEQERLHLTYWPDLPGTPDHESRIEVEGLISRGYGFGIGTYPTDELRVGDPLYVAIVSATGDSRTYVDWMLSGTYTFATLPSPTITAASACAP